MMSSSSVLVFLDEEHKYTCNQYLIRNIVTIFAQFWWSLQVKGPMRHGGGVRHRWRWQTSDMGTGYKHNTRAHPQTRAHPCVPSVAAQHDLSKIKSRVHLLLLRWFGIISHPKRIRMHSLHTQFGQAHFTGLLESNGTRWEPMSSCSESDGDGGGGRGRDK